MEIYNLYMEHEISNDQKFKVGDELISLDGISKPTTPYTDMTFGMGYEGYPAVNMTHYSATKFCQWLSINTGYYYRLPTEAEWEYASRAGSRKDNWFGDEVSVIDDYAWHKENSGGKYQKVGQKKPNDWGLYDMLGNVSEWVADSYEERIFKSRGIRKNPFVYDKVNTQKYTEEDHGKINLKIYQVLKDIFQISHSKKRSSNSKKFMVEYRRTIYWIQSSSS